MATKLPVQVGVRELKSRLTAYLRLAKSNREVIVTERGRPIAVIEPISRASRKRSIDAKIAALAARGEVVAPVGQLVSRIRRAKISGAPISTQILEDRR